MTAEQWAAFDFEPWTHTDDEEGARRQKNGWSMGDTLVAFDRMSWMLCTGQTSSWLRAARNTG